MLIKVIAVRIDNEEFELINVNTEKKTLFIDGQGRLCHQLPENFNTQLEQSLGKALQAGKFSFDDKQTVPEQLTLTAPLTPETDNDKMNVQSLLQELPFYGTTIE